MLCGFACAVDGGVTGAEIFSTIGVEKCCTVGVVWAAGIGICATDVGAGDVGKGICWIASAAENKIKTGWFSLLLCNITLCD